MSNKTPPSDLVKCACHKCGAAGFFGPDPDIKKKPFCPDCEGSAWLLRPLAETKPCPVCGGLNNPDHEQQLCVTCASTGRVAADPAAPFVDQTKLPPPVEARLARIEARLDALETLLNH